MHTKTTSHCGLPLVCLLLCALSSTLGAALSPYREALSYYEAGNYAAAAEGFQALLSNNTHSQEGNAASIYFHLAYCKFHTKKYRKSAKYFHFFYENFPKEANIEEAVYMWGHTLYLKSPDIRLDQSITQEALQACDTYLIHYPQGRYISKVRRQREGLYAKLAHQSFNQAKFYYKIHRYKAAFLYLSEFQKNFPKTCHSEEAAYLRISAQYSCFKDMASESQCLQEGQVEARLDMAVHDCREFLSIYPHGKYTKLVEHIHVLLLDFRKTHSI